MVLYFYLPILSSGLWIILPSLNDLIIHDLRHVKHTFINYGITDLLDN